MYAVAAIVIMLAAMGAGAVIGITFSTFLIISNIWIDVPPWTILVSVIVPMMFTSFMAYRKFF